MNLFDRLFSNMDQWPYLIIALIIGFSVHEFSHAYVAYRFGDPTAKRQGRLTLNPIVHLDPIGTLMIFIAGFGWAKPVPVNYFYLRDKKYAGVLVSIAGPISNFLVATIMMGLLYIFILIDPTFLGDKVVFFILHTLDMVVSLNIVLFLFNLLPIPPLDGYRIIEDLAPAHWKPKLTMWETYGGFVLLLLVITPLGDYVFDPIFNGAYPAILNALSQFYQFVLPI